MRRTAMLFLAALATAAVVLTGCSSSSSSTSGAGAGSASASGGAKITIGSDQANDHGTEDAAGKSSFEIEADNDDGFYFKPTVVTGSANQKITLEIKNEGTVPHNFSIESLNVNVTLEPGSSQQVQVTFPASGTTEFFCSFHRSQGMAGELQVA
jgi:plastocyanin